MRPSRGGELTVPQLTRRGEGFRASLPLDIRVTPAAVHKKRVCAIDPKCNIFIVVYDPALGEVHQVKPECWQRIKQSWIWPAATEQHRE